MDTEAIDKLYLELSQFTQAKTARELALEGAVNNIDRAFADYCNARSDVSHNPNNVITNVLLEHMSLTLDKLGGAIGAAQKVADGV